MILCLNKNVKRAILLYPVAQEYHGRTVRRGSFGASCTPGKPINRNMPLWIRMSLSLFLIYYCCQSMFLATTKGYCAYLPQFYGPYSYNYGCPRRLLCVMDYEFVVFLFKIFLPFLDSSIILSSACFYGVLACFLMLRISFLSCFALGREELLDISLQF